MHPAFIKKGNEEKNTKETLKETLIEPMDSQRVEFFFFFLFPFLWKFIDDDISINICMLHFDWIAQIYYSYRSKDTHCENMYMKMYCR